MFKAWFQFDRQKGIEYELISYEVKQRILPRDECLKFKSNRHLCPFLADVVSNLNVGSYSSKYK